SDFHTHPSSLPEPPERQLAANSRIRHHREPGPVNAEAEAGERDSREWQWNLVPGEEAGERDSDADQADERDGEGDAGVATAAEAAGEDVENRQGRAAAGDD